MIDRYGLERYVRDSGAAVAHADEVGTLYRIDVPNDEPIVTVSVTNSTPEPDGTSKQYLLRVPPDITTARAAVAWSFGLTAEEYCPAVET